jgi:hypothetical protein
MHVRPSFIAGASWGLAWLLASGGALASNPLESPDNGSASFSRGGAWLATGNDPIAAHYNPAGLALQPTGGSLEVNLSFNHVCFDRLNAGNAPTGPRQEAQPTADGDLQYDPACNARPDFPRAVPSIAVAWRVTDRLGLGLALVPPAAYGSALREWPAFSQGYNARTGAVQTVPSPYRYMTVGNLSTILFPTASAGYEIAPGLRVGAGFISGIAVLNVSSTSAASVAANDVADHAVDDAQSRLLTKDLFVPGAVLGMHWSPTSHLDVALWGRWLDAIRTHQADLTVIGHYYAADLASPRPICQEKDTFSTKCQGLAIKNEYSDALTLFKFAIPPEIRAGVRFHQPRSKAAVLEAGAHPAVDPLRDDVFDVELDGSYTVNSVTDAIEVRFRQTADGTAVVPVAPLGKLPPNADRYTGYKDSVGARLGGQYNVLAGKLGLRAGSWFETAAANADYLNVAPVPALRGGFGGGIVLRQDGIDFQLGFQHHWSAGLDNAGEGSIVGNAGVLRECAGQGCPAPGQGAAPPFQIGKSPAEQQFRTFQAVNGGNVTQSANVFTVGGVVRFR